MLPTDVPDGPLVIDTDVLSMIIWEKERYREFEPLIEGHILTISFATVAELRTYALVAKFGNRRTLAMEARIRQLIVLPSADAVTERFAHLNARFRERLKGGGVNDMWIAACALAQTPALPLVTANLSDFQTIAGEFPLSIVHPDL